MDRDKCVLPVEKLFIKRVSKKLAFSFVVIRLFMVIGRTDLGTTIVVAPAFTVLGHLQLIPDAKYLPFKR